MSPQATNPDLALDRSLHSPRSLKSRRPVPSVDQVVASSRAASVGLGSGVVSCCDVDQPTRRPRTALSSGAYPPWLRTRFAGSGHPICQVPVIGSSALFRSRHTCRFLFEEPPFDGDQI